MIILNDNGAKRSPLNETTVGNLLFSLVLHFYSSNVLMKLVHVFLGTSFLFFECFDEACTWDLFNFVNLLSCEAIFILHITF